MSKRDTAKLVQFQRGQVQKRSASATAKAFTSKQSHFARRSEEDAILQKDLTTNPLATGTVTSKFADQRGKTAAPTFIGKTKKTNFGLNDDSDNLLKMERGLGQNINNNNNGSSSQVPRDGESGEPLNDKRARFEEILDRSRDAKAEKKVLRNEQERETDKIDEDFNEVTKLLKTKSKKEEQQEEFFTLGSEKTRARLAEFFAERNSTKGREFVIGANKKSLVNKGEMVSRNEMQRRAKKLQENPDAALKEQQEEQDKEKLDPRVQALLSTLPVYHQKHITSKIASSTGGATVTPAPTSSKKQLKNDVEDSFDQLLGQMIFSKVVYAGDKTLSADDELLERFQEEVVDLDRSKQDAAGRLVPEVQDRSRREWLQRGGDDVYRMGDGDDADSAELTHEELRQKAKLKKIELTRQEELGESDEDDDVDEDFDFDADVDYDKFNVDADGIRIKKDSSSKKKASGSSKQLQQDDEDDEDDENGEDAALAMNPVDDSLAELEEAFNMCKKTQDTEPIKQALQKLHEVSALRPRMAAESFRLLFLDIHAHHSQRKHLTPFHLLVLRAATNMFPMTDVSRHPVAAPLSSLLPSLMFSGPSLDTTRDAAVVLFLASTMMDLLSGGARRGSASSSKPFFAAEPYVAILNVLCLQLPLTDLAPKGKSAKLNAPFPVFLRASEPVLTNSSSSSKTAGTAVDELTLSEILFGTPSSISSQAVLKTAYSLMRNYLDNFLRHNPSCPSLIEDNITNFLVARLQKRDPNQDGQIKSLISFSQSLIDEVLAERAPLAMRTFRPRPLRQYEPLLLDDSEDSVKERRVIKKELREDKKRVIRSVQAEAAVERRTMERDARAEDAHRSSKYNQLIAELQNQQHIMNHVDAIKAKGKSKFKKGLSGDYDQPTSGDGDGGGGGGDE